MTSAFTSNGTYATPPNGRYSSPKLSQESDKTPSPLKESSEQPLIKILKVFIDANLSQETATAEKINGQVRQIPSINEILKLIVARKEDIIREESPDNVQDLEGFFESITKLRETPLSPSLVNFDLLDSLYAIADKVCDFKLSDRNRAYKAMILTHCGQLSAHYLFSGGKEIHYFNKRNWELIKHFLKT